MPINPKLEPILLRRKAMLNSPSDYLIGMSNKPQNYRTQPKKLQIYLDKLFNNPRQIDKSDSKRRIVTHSLRHTFGSNLAINGVSPLVIMRLMDHSSLEMTQRYAKIADKNRKEAVELL